MTISRRELLEHALLGMKQKRIQIDDQMREILAELTPEKSAATQKGIAQMVVLPFGEATTKKKRKGFSAATRKKMALSQKARWAKLKGTAPKVVSEKPPAPKKRHLSAAGRRRIIESTKARWARAKATGQNKLGARGKKAAAKTMTAGG